MTRSTFERISLRLARKIQVSSSDNLEESKHEPLSPAKSSQINNTNNSNTSEQNNNLNKTAPVEIKHVFKDVMNNSVSQAMLKLFHTPYKELKILLVLFVLLTISSR